VVSDNATKSGQFGMDNASLTMSTVDLKQLATDVVHQPCDTTTPRNHAFIYSIAACVSSQSDSNSDLLAS